MRMDNLGPRTFRPAGHPRVLPDEVEVGGVDWKNWMVSAGRGVRKGGAARCEVDTGWSEGQK
jgi:hypothetical protein